MCWGLYLASPNQGEKPDLGIAVAKKLAKRAVDRNQLKRMIRELLRNAQAISLNSDVVVKLKKPIGRETRGRLRSKEKEGLRAQIVGLI
ncbi:ribonuclease P protein component [Polynucleobacter sp. AP-Elch-400A-B2]|nr:ribonuclease P protein component [Polynucleobacter sp. AP-Elch-400A-B2]